LLAALGTRAALGTLPAALPRAEEIGLDWRVLIFAGGIYIPPEILAHAEPIAAASPPPHGRPIVSPSEIGLSDRQLDVLAHLMQGKNNKVICRVLGLAEPTVKNHVTAILRALKVTNRTQAVVAVNELGWKLPANPKA